MKDHMKTLYKIDSQNRIRVWKIWTEGAIIIQEAGLEDGKLVKNNKIAKSKNVGKSNETTAEEQAVLEMESTYNSKLNEGYFKTKEEAKNNLVILPMLAKSLEDCDIDWLGPVYSQIKFDGQRCMTIVKDGKVTLISRGGKEITTVNHIKRAIEKVVTEKSNFILDGELYNKSLGGFQYQMRAIKKYTKNLTELINYNIYDVVENSPYTMRMNTVAEVVRLINNPSIIKVESIAINPKSLEQLHGKYLEEGYEGSIIRHTQLGYELSTRSKSLLKYKDFQDVACEVIDVIPSDARPEQGVIVCKLRELTFKANPKFSHEERAEILKKKLDYIGSIAEIRYFELSEDGIPRFPICVGFKND